MATKRRKSPWLKKQDEYDLNYRPHMENPHAFRKNWPKKKARANRSERAKVRAILATEEPADLTAERIKSVHRGQQPIIKSAIVTLRQRIEDNRKDRARKANRKKLRVRAAGR